MAGRPTAPGPFVPSDIPGDGEQSVALVAEFRKVSVALAGLNRLVPQVATAAPKLPVDGMIRLSRSPWWPSAGQTADKWVYYDAPSLTWKLLP